MGTRAGELLLQAAEIVNGARNRQHGEKERSLACIAEAWDWYLRNRKTGRNGVITAVDVSAMQELLKMGRFLCGEPILDHAIDRAGYAAITGELAEVASANTPKITGHVINTEPNVLSSLVDAVPATQEKVVFGDRLVPRARV